MKKKYLFQLMFLFLVFAFISFFAQYISYQNLKAYPHEYSKVQIIEQPIATNMRIEITKDYYFSIINDGEPLIINSIQTQKPDGTMGNTCRELLFSPATSCVTEFTVYDQMPKCRNETLYIGINRFCHINGQFIIETDQGTIKGIALVTKKSMNYSWLIAGLIFLAIFIYLKKSYSSNPF